jgi:murein DD-endopeptidase MepM/ murein hydrolase activator NlpD
MPRTLPILLLVACSALARANNTDDSVPLRVTTFDGEVHEGSPKFLRSKLELRGTRKRKVRYRDIAAISDVPPPSEEELAARRRKYTARAGRAEGAPAWKRLGDWAREQGLEDEALQAFRQALELDPEHRPTRNALGEVSSDGAWVPTREAVDGRRPGLAADDLDGWIDLANFARRGRDLEPAMDILQGVMRQDNFHTKGLEALKPLTDTYRQKRALVLPVRGRWKASLDRSRHHSLKHYAVYALDLNRVDDENRLYTGKGKQLEDYFAWDAPFYAVAAGTVVEVRDGRPDNPIGKIGDAAEKHNGVSISHGDGEFSWYVHAKQGSIVVKEGQRVAAGQLLGTVGNSGGSAIPHLHFTLTAYDRTSVPWACDDYSIVAPDGTPLRVTRACPREGWVLVGPTPEVEPTPPEEGGDADDEDDATRADGAE